MIRIYFLHKLKSILEISFSIILIFTCVYNYLNAPASVCSLVKCNDSITTVVKAMFPRSIAIACLVSRIAIVYKSVRDFPQYTKKIERYELHFPTEISKKRHHFYCAVSIVVAYVIIILPINVLRIYLIYFNLRDTHTLLFQIMMYVQNMSVCATEIHFILMCIGLYQKFQVINEDIDVVKSVTIIANKYPNVLKTEGSSRHADVGPKSDDDPTASRMGTQQLANRIELLRMRHQFVRGTVFELNDLFGIQLGLSMCVLLIMTLFDIYGEVITNYTKTRSKVLIYGWLLQYSFRFIAIVLTTHTTTKQVLIRI